MGISIGAVDEKSGVIGLRLVVAIVAFTMECRRLSQERSPSCTAQAEGCGSIRYSDFPG